MSEFDEKVDALANLDQASDEANVFLAPYGEFSLAVMNLREAHEREVEQAGNGRNMTVEEVVEGLSDEELAEYGLARLPRDADGKVWDGSERKFFSPVGFRHDTDVMGLEDDGWFLFDSSGNKFLPSECSHVPDKLADTPASLADELENASEADYEDMQAAVLHVAHALRVMGGGAR